MKNVLMISGLVFCSMSYAKDAQPLKQKLSEDARNGFSEELHSALCSCSLPRVEVALAKGASDLKKDKDFDIVLRAAGCEDERIFKILMEHGFSPNAKQGVLEKSVLQSAASYGDLRAAQRLIDAGAEIDGCDRLGNTPLMEAVAHCKTDMVQAMAVLWGADLTKRNKVGLTACEMVARCDHLSAYITQIIAGHLRRVYEQQQQSKS